MATNKNAATEDQVGYLHGALTKLFKAKLDALLKMIEEDPDTAAFAVQGKDLAAVIKWIDQNGITATPADMQEVTKLSDRIEALRAKSKGQVVQFVKEG